MKKTMKTIMKKIANKKYTSMILFATLLVGTFALTGCGNPTPSQTATSEVPAIPSGAYISEQEVPLENETSSVTQQIEYPARTITVNSSETVAITPDIAEIVYAVRTQSTTAAACHEENSKSVNQVTDLLISLNVASDSIQTTDFYMNPVYNYSNNTQKVVGYEATTTLTVSDLPIDDLGDLLSQSVQSGINTIQSITYMSSSYDEGYQAALTLAVESAHQKAQVLAEASGALVGDVLLIQENSNYSNARYTDYALTRGLNSMSSMKEMAADESMNIMPGEVAVDVNITVEYQIK